MIIISINGIRDWKPLSRTHKLDRLKDEIQPSELLALELDFARWSLEFLKYRAKEAVRRQVFPQNYAPLSKSWAAFKAKHALKPGFWEASGFLLEHLSVWQDPQSQLWHIGWPGTLIHPGYPPSKPGATKAVLIAKALELGVPENNLPARPLFVPLAQAYSKRILVYFRQFCAAHHPEYLRYLDSLGESGESITTTFKTPIKRN